MTRARIIGAALVLLLAGLWFLSERIFFAMNWKDMGLDGPDIIAGLEADLSTGRTGLTTTDTPCMKERAAIDLSIRFGGYLPSGDDLLMKVTVTGTAALFDQVYLGPPVPVVTVEGAPLCLDTPDPLRDSDNAAFAYLGVAFYDRAGNRYQTFGSEDAEPIFAWQDLSVELLETPEESRSEGITTLRISPLM